MYATDFEYDGRRLSDFGFIICTFDSFNGDKTEDGGAVIEFNTTPMRKGMKHSLVSTSYEDCIESKFHICKDPDYNSDLEITEDEYRNIARWLNRREFLPLKFLDDKSFSPCYFDASFNLAKTKIREILYGIELKMVTNRPFGYGKKRTCKYELSAEGTFAVKDLSDDIGYIYPNLTISCEEDGDYTITNETLGEDMKISDCVKGEIIKVNGETFEIKSNKEDIEGRKNIEDRFDYNYLKIGNTYSNRVNEISVNMACTILLEYYPVIKDVP